MSMRVRALVMPTSVVFKDEWLLDNPGTQLYAPLTGEANSPESPENKIGQWSTRVDS